jgi:predicted DNA-binding helix-hairpin-helix protein
MDQVAKGVAENKRALTVYRHAPRFVPAGQSTQMIIGASPETDYHILRLASGLYRKYSLKRVFYSAYIPTASDTLLPSLDTKPPLLREHRLYQADFLMRQYQFQAEEILSEDMPNFNPFLDPKCNWAINHMERFPVDVNKAPLETLLRVPGIGPVSAKRIVAARRSCALTLEGLKRLGVVLKRAQYFIAVSGGTGLSRVGREGVVRALVDPKAFQFGAEQLSLFSPGPQVPAIEAGTPLGQALEEAVSCLASSF